MLYSSIKIEKYLLYYFRLKRKNEEIKNLALSLIFAISTGMFATDNQ